MLAKPRILLRIEGACVLGCGIFAYHLVGASWIFFLVCFLWPDLSMMGYWVNAKVGACVYNLVHTETLPFLLAAGSFQLHESGGVAFALIWVCHIGLDRAFGFGLKHATAFKDTHLQPTVEPSEFRAHEVLL